MLFNSLDFAFFLPVVFLLYWFITHKNLKFQNFLIVAASYFFYGWWDWRFLSLIIISTLVDFSVGRYLFRSKDKVTRKMLLITSIMVNIGLLGFFKYYNFFLENFITAFSFFGSEIKANSLHIILPVGISFYTFQTLSYTIDIYRGKIKSTDDLLAFAAFVSFFPQLVAGPIERAANLLPQFKKRRAFSFEKAMDGAKQMLWGFFKKVVIADNCAEMANEIFNNSGDYNSFALFLGAVFFAFQIYGDFSGYSDIAIGTARLFGFKLMRNFANPYFSRDIAEFWRRWHISLSTWFRDYVYIPLGGSRVEKPKMIRNVFVIFLVSGFWHGANWTFIVWGALNALYFLPLLFSRQNRKNLDTVAEGRLFPNLREMGQMLFTFLLTVLAWIFFRAEDLGHAIQYLSGIFDFISPGSPIKDAVRSNQLLIMIAIFMFVEWLGRKNQYAIEYINQPKVIQVGFYLIIGAAILFLGNFNETEFIYFAF
jgi:D-alanyl-lipoteichoic acid acyltransferase DltB (MBOAT superfamily)